FAVASVEIVALALSLYVLEWPGIVFFGTTAVLFAGFFVTLLTVRGECRSACPMDRSRRRTLFPFVVLIVAAVGVWMYWLPDEPHITISKETTYITEPLDADGFPDYLAEINRRAVCHNILEFSARVLAT
ncbi:MAG: hypothetical protein IH899_18905, partial [Planctomycetes bacterium]|nr:hypothetical protein [Planctomycetota bacterium]